MSKDHPEAPAAQRVRNTLCKYDMLLKYDIHLAVLLLMWTRALSPNSFFSITSGLLDIPPHHPSKVVVGRLLTGGVGVVLGGGLVIGRQGSAAGLTVRLLAQTVGESVVPGKRKTNKTNTVRPTPALIQLVSMPLRQIIYNIYIIKYKIIGLLYWVIGNYRLH